ncbi:MAG TPA: hypothetical protein VNR42_01025 [Solirubrobacteraceae bacterium]|nr:hypothetical protein [Solirubrobacteraceae bacterium]
MEAFLARFEMYVIERSQADVMPRLRSWRTFASAVGFEPGPGTVRLVAEHELPAEVARLLERARAKADGPAPDHVRARAIEALASHFDGDLGFAGELVESMEEKGALPAAIAHALADARKVAA